MQLSNNQQAFLALVRAGLWEEEVKLSQFGDIDYNEVYRLAEEQSVVGLVAAGVEHIVDVKVPQEVALQFVGASLQLEHRNAEINDFIPKLINKLRDRKVFCLMIKGQGVAQCYERPQWRAAGDVDLLLDVGHYQKAKEILMPISYDVEKEDFNKMHLAMTILGITIELHGKMPFGMSEKADKVISAILNDSLREGKVCTWSISNTDVSLPIPDNHIIIIFTHFLRHFFIEGVGLRQICDWCRLLWTYKNSLNRELLESRIRKMGLLSEWKAFASLAVDTLGMPVEVMPLYDARFKDKGLDALRRVMKRGNFGHNNDLSYRTRYSGFSYKIVAAWRRFVDFASLVPVFPVDAQKFFFTYLFSKAK